MAMKGKIRDEKVGSIKTALSKESFFFTNLDITSKNDARGSFSLTEMIRKSSRLKKISSKTVFQMLLKFSPEKKKIFRGISLSLNTVANRITN